MSIPNGWKIRKIFASGQATCYSVRELSTETLVLKGRPYALLALQGLVYRLVSEVPQVGKTKQNKNQKTTKNIKQNKNKQHPKKTATGKLQ